MTAPRRSSNHLQQAAYAALGGRFIGVNSTLVRRVGSSAAILLAQLLFWAAKKAQGAEVYKTVDEMYQETGLRRRSQETAVRRCVQLGIIRVRLKGIPPRRHFLVDSAALFRLAIRSDLEGSLVTSRPDRKERSVPNTPEKTPENTKKSLQEKSAA